MLDLVRPDSLGHWHGRDKVDIDMNDAQWRCCLQQVWKAVLAACMCPTFSQMRAFAHGFSVRQSDWALSEDGGASRWGA